MTLTIVAPPASPTTDDRVGRIAAERPLATRVFARYGIDFCCGGGRSLAAACAERGLDPVEVVAEIERETGADVGPVRRWDEASLGELVDHIVAAFHHPLREELPRLEAMARKVLAVHGEKDPATLTELVDVFAGLRRELEDHMTKEEQVLFPMVRRGDGASAGCPIAAIEREHEDAAAALRRLRELTQGYVVPEGACTTWRALWHGLAALETTMHEHVHLENNVLFPRALAG